MGIFGRRDKDMDDYEDDDFQDDEYEGDEDGDLKMCQNCGKMWPREDLCYVNAPFGKVMCVCSRCASGMASSEYSSSDD